MPGGEPRDGTVQSVDRAISILQAIANHDSGAAGVTEISEALGVHKSTVFRLLATLEARGFVEQGVDRGKYRLGGGLAQLAASAPRAQDLTRMCRPVLVELAERLGESSNLTIRDGDAVVTVDQVLGSAAISSVDWVGRRSPMYTTAAGKLFLADLPAGEVESLVGPSPAGRTSHSIVDAALLAAQLEAARAHGYATSFEEDEEGLVAIGAPIRGATGKVVAVLGISGPGFRLNSRTAPQVAADVVEAADRLSWRHGFVKPA